MEDSLITLREAAKIMGCSYAKAQKLAKTGEVPFRKLGATWVISKSALFNTLGLRY